MKNTILSVLTLLFVSLFTFQATAQSEKAAVLKMWDEVWKAYEANDEAKMWSFYAEDACEIFPDGSAICGLAAIRKGYEEFKTMVEGTPSWAMSEPDVHMLEPNVALLIADVTADIKLKDGQQIGGKSKFAAIVHKVKGKWLIAFDSQTPVLPMPEAGK